MPLLVRDTSDGENIARRRRARFYL